MFNNFEADRIQTFKRLIKNTVYHNVVYVRVEPKSIFRPELNMEHRVSKLIPLISLTFLAFLNAGYASATELYAEVNTSYSSAKIEDEKFNPLSLETRLGFYLEKQVGIEAYFGTGLNDDSQAGLDLSLNTIAGVNLRFESPETKEGMKLFILLGYGFTQWDVNRSNTGEPGKVDFDDFTYGGGFEWRLGKSEHWFVNVRGQRYLNKNDISLDTGSLGVRYAF